MYIELVLFNTFTLKVHYNDSYEVTFLQGLHAAFEFLIGALGIFQKVNDTFRTISYPIPEEKS